MRMAPNHVKHKFWWELIFISVLIYLVVGVRSQKKQELVAAAQATAAAAMAALAQVNLPPVVELDGKPEIVAVAPAALAPAAVVGALVTPPPSPLALK